MRETLLGEMINLGGVFHLFGGLMGAPGVMARKDGLPDVNRPQDAVVVVVGAAYNYIYRITSQWHCTIDTVITHATVTVHFH